MILTTEQLKIIIKEEIESVLVEAVFDGRRYIVSDDEISKVINSIKKQKERLAVEAGKLNKVFTKKQKFDNALKKVKVFPKEKNIQTWIKLMDEWDEFSKDGWAKKKQIDDEIEAFMNKTQEFMDAGDIKGFAKWEKSVGDDILDRSGAIAEELLMTAIDYVFEKSGGFIPEGLPIEHVQSFLNQQIEHFRYMFKKTKEIIKIEQNYLSNLEQMRKKK